MLRKRLILLDCRHNILIPQIVVIMKDKYTFYCLNAMRQTIFTAKGYKQRWFIKVTSIK